ncbi:MAG: cobalamin-binding protein [Desulfobacterales bacterium CG23_combo_of_CG06-09_8_20_14_all_51_8]|nr:MAG: cobalamin-binding protein [Desulfobacterales bacterium CG23_combo_of_CG06-09_8_20_14_all_51_8]
MMKKKYAIFWVGLVLLCGTLMALTTEAREMIDQTGRTVNVPESPKRVVSLAPSITEIIYDLGCEDRLKGVTTYSDFPEAAKALPKVGSYVYLDLEKIVSLKPDLCIGIKDGNPKETVMRLEALGIPVYAVNPRSLATIHSTVIEIGDLLEAPAAARRVADTMQERLDHVRRKVQTAGPRPRIFFQIGIAPIVSAGSDTFIHELIEAAGGVNLAGTYTGYPRFSFEEIVAAGPDMLIITSMDREQAFEEARNTWRKWHTIPAVKNDRIFLVDSNLFDRPTPRLMDGLEILARLIHPELDFDKDRQ